MLDHIGFPVSDYERAKAFYTHAFLLRCMSSLMAHRVNFACAQQSGRFQGGRRPVRG